MKYLLTIFFVLFGFDFEYQHQVPTTNGINNYITFFGEDIAVELQEYLKDSIYDFFIKTDDLSEYTDYDTMELGRFYYPDEIIINNEEKFLEYELRLLPKPKQRQNRHSGKFVKAVVIHELSHVYFNQVVRVMQYNKQVISKDYVTERQLLGNKTNWCVEFIEEGICEYISQKMGESLYDDDFDVKSTKIIAMSNDYLVKYRYSSAYVREFMDSCIKADGSPRQALEILIRNPAPSIDEIIYKEKYFNRLK